MRKFCAILCTVALTVGMTTSAFAEEADSSTSSPSSVNTSTSVITAESLEEETAKTSAAIAAAIASGALDSSEYTVDEDGNIALQFTATDGSTVTISADDAILVLKPIAEQAITDKYNTHADELEDALAQAEADGDEEKAAELKNAITINKATAAVIEALLNKDLEEGEEEVEFWTTYQEYLDRVLAAAAEIDSSVDALINVLQIDKESGEVKEPEVDLSALEAVTTELFEVAYTDVDNLVDNGDGTYSVDDYETYIAKNGKAAEHVEEAETKAAATTTDASEAETESETEAATEEYENRLIYYPTKLNVSETLKDFDWEHNTLYFVLQDVNYTSYIITITEDMIVDGILTMDVPCCGSGTFYSIPIPEEETETETETDTAL